MDSTITVVGGGWAGVAAALAARAGGRQRVVLLERTDLLLGCGLSGGIMRNNGRHTAAEEMTAMGAGDLFRLADDASIHRDVDFPGHRHAWLHSTTALEPVVRRFLAERGVEIRFRTRVTDTRVRDGKITALVLADESLLACDAVVEATGSAGPVGNCARHGNGCAMCVLRCPSFGPRASLSARAGLDDCVGMRRDGGVGSFSGAFELRGSSLSSGLRAELASKGFAVVPLPEESRHGELLAKKSCQQYALPEFAENLVLLDTGDTVKVMTPFFPVERLRLLPGLENAMPQNGNGSANSVRFLARAPRDDTMAVDGLDHFWCAGEKAGFFVGHTEAIVTGTLAGHNARRRLAGETPATLPRETVCGDLIAVERERLAEPGGLAERHTFSGGAFFARMRERSLYDLDAARIRERVARAGCAGLFSRP